MSKHTGPGVCVRCHHGGCGHCGTTYADLEDGLSAHLNLDEQVHMPAAPKSKTQTSIIFVISQFARPLSFWAHTHTHARTHTGMKWQSQMFLSACHSDFIWNLQDKHWFLWNVHWKFWHNWRRHYIILEPVDLGFLCFSFKPFSKGFNFRNLILYILSLPTQFFTHIYFFPLSAPPFVFVFSSWC